MVYGQLLDKHFLILIIKKVTITITIVTIRIRKWTLAAV